MILDTSVIVAITLREPGYEELVSKIRSASTLGVGTPTLTEAGMVFCHHAWESSRRLYWTVFSGTSG